MKKLRIALVAEKLEDVKHITYYISRSNPKFSEQIDLFFCDNIEKLKEHTTLSKLPYHGYVTGSKHFPAHDAMFHYLYSHNVPKLTDEALMCTEPKVLAIMLNVKLEEAPKVNWLETLPEKDGKYWLAMKFYSNGGQPHSTDMEMITVCAGGNIFQYKGKNYTAEELVHKFSLDGRKFKFAPATIPDFPF